MRKPLRMEDLREFIDCDNPTNRNQRTETWHAEKNPDGRWRKFAYDELIARDKTSLDLFRLKDDSLADLDNLPEPEVPAEEIVENIEAGLVSLRNVVAALGRQGGALKKRRRRGHKTDQLEALASPAWARVGSQIKSLPRRPAEGLS